MLFGSHGGVDGAFCCCEAGFVIRGGFIAEVEKYEGVPRRNGQGSLDRGGPVHGIWPKIISKSRGTGK